MTNNTMDANRCRDRPAQLLGEELAIYGALQELLEQEHAVLQNKDTAALQRSGDARQERMRSLIRIDDARRALCRAHGYQPDPAGFKRLLRWCDPEGSLQARWKECSVQAALCRRSNDRNGGIALGRATRAETLLRALDAASSHAATYSTRGRYSAPRSVRVLGEA